MDYYFTRAERNSPPRGGEEKKSFKTEDTEVRHRDHREEALRRQNLGEVGRSMLRPY
jgi:hypothetical protein